MQAPDVKITVVGNAGVGKTALIMAYMNGVFPVEYLPRQVDREVFPATYRGGTIELENVDRLRPVYYPGTSVFLICFDVMRRRTLDDALSRWHSDVTRAVPAAKCVLVGTRSDLRADADSLAALRGEGHEAVSQAEAAAAAKRLGAVAYLETSARLLAGVREVFQCAIAAGMVGKVPRPPVMPPKPPRPVIRLPPSTMDQEIRAIVRAACAAYHADKLGPLFSSVTREGNGVTVHVLRPEHADAFFVVLQVCLAIYGVADTALPPIAGLASALDLTPNELLAHCDEMVSASAKRQQMRNINSEEHARHDAVVAKGGRSHLPPPEPTELPPLPCACMPGLQQLFDAKACSDIQFLCGANPQPIHAHRAVLAMRCERFRALFASATMRLLFLFLYTDDYSSVSDARLILAAANEYGLARLKLLAATELANGLSPENVLETLEAAVTHDCEALAEVCKRELRCSWSVYSARQDVKQRLSAAQWNELEQTQHPPLSHLQAMDAYRAQAEKESCVVQ